MQPGEKVIVAGNASRIGVLGNETDGSAHRLRVLVHFLDGEEEFVLKSSLEQVVAEREGSHGLMHRGHYGRVIDLRRAVTHNRLTGRLANLIYSLNTTNTEFLAYQFKPVLNFLDSPSNGILIADEVGLGKTIEAGLIWTELRAREDAKRLLVLCPAMLCDKWKMELRNRFGVRADIVDAKDLLKVLAAVHEKQQDSFALIASIQGLRPPEGWNNPDGPQRASAKLARLLESLEADADGPLLDLVIVDEAHYLRNQTTQTHQLAVLLRPLTQYLALLSATPIQMRSRDLFNLLHLLDADAFPNEWSYNFSMQANAPIVGLRDRVLAGPVTVDEFIDSLQCALTHRIFDKNEQLQFLLDNPPMPEQLITASGRSALADQLDRINPLAKVVTRTLKRHVQEFHVVRDPVIMKATLSATERAFYDAVTAAVRNYCDVRDTPPGFLVTIPQRQMSSCMAAACERWIGPRPKAGFKDDELIYELGIGGADDRADEIAEEGDDEDSLLNTLKQIAREVGNLDALRSADSKFALLLQHLQAYWRAYPRKKVVLFAFFRGTLRYLYERLAKVGVNGVVLHGGMDKQAVLRQFEALDGAQILLSSEVASEGVDLQFCSLVVNYDLPWNPAKIEQRIGRIDRIGQESEKILIWNLVYENTLDDRVHGRLLERLEIFQTALGSMEVILGDEIRKLTLDLLSHQLTAEQESDRIDQAAVAIETQSRQQRQLEEQATHLIAHGEFIQNKVRAAKELGRYVRGEDLLAYARDYLENAYPGTAFVADDQLRQLVTLRLSLDAKTDFHLFLEDRKLGGETSMFLARPPQLLFENRLGKVPVGQEKVTQDHPLIRFVTDRQKSGTGAHKYAAVSAIELDSALVMFAPAGKYVYVVMRWSFQGSRDIERLEYFVQNLATNELLEAESAEQLVNSAALSGRDWLGVRGALDHPKTAQMQDECRAELLERFLAFRDAQQREDRDRIRLMVASLEHHIEEQRRRSAALLEAHNGSGNPKRLRLVPAVMGKLKRLCGFQ